MIITCTGNSVPYFNNDIEIGIFDQLEFDLAESGIIMTNQTRGGSWSLLETCPRLAAWVMQQWSDRIYQKRWVLEDGAWQLDTNTAMYKPGRLRDDGLFLDLDLSDEEYVTAISDLREAFLDEFEDRVVRKLKDGLWSIERKVHPDVDIIITLRRHDPELERYLCEHLDSIQTKLNKGSS